MRKLMRSNPVRLSILLWFAGWMLVVMPGHTRGIVRLPGSEPSEQSRQASCCKPKPSCCDKDRSEDGPARPTDPAKHCAICFLSAHLTDPPPVLLYTPYLGELEELAFLVESSISDDLAAPQLLRGRGPPA